MADLRSGARLEIQFNDQGLVPAIVQDTATGRVLMLGWMNDAALRQTLQTGKATFYSRSRKKIWVKGEQSGHVQQVIEARVDCDQDAVLLRCRPHGPCCHAGYESCFFRAVEGRDSLQPVDEKVFEPDEVYGT